MLVQDAERLLREKNYSESYNKFKDARDMFDSLAQGFPGWQHLGMVNGRRKLVRREMATIKTTLQNLQNTNPEVASKHLSVLEEVWKPELPSRPEGNKITPPKGAGANNPGGQAKGRYERLTRRIADLSNKNDQLLTKLEESESDLRSAKKDLVLAKARQRDLNEKLVETNSELTVADTKKERETSVLKKQIEDLKDELKKATGLLGKANDRAGKILDNLSAANQTIRNLRQERESLLDERNKMMAILDMSAGDPTSPKALMAENARLKRELENARTIAEKLENDKEHDTQMISDLRLQLANVRGELDRVTRENQDYQRQIAALTARLQQTSERLAASAKSTMTVPEAEAENRVLKRVIRRQLAQHARREQAKKIVLKELAKLEQRSDGLLTAIEGLAGPGMELNQEEQGLLKDPQFEEYLTTAGVSAVLLHKGTAGTSDQEMPTGAKDRAGLPADLRAFATAAETQFNRGNFYEAERNFSNILRREPQNVFALANQGVVKLRLNKPKDAELLLKKALAYDYENDFSHYLLGMTYYRQGQAEQAIGSIEMGLKINPKNARARHCLGVIASAKGMQKRAVEEFRHAISIDPKYGDAHFNLAVLYATAEEPSMDLARKHYQQALACGSKPDNRLEKFIGIEKVPDLVDPTTVSIGPGFQPIFV